MKSGRAILALTVASMAFNGGCVRVESLAGTRLESSCVGRTYELRVACYVVRPSPSWKDRTLVLSPDTAVHEGLPLPVSEERIGESFRGELIVDVMPAGTALVVVDVKRLSSYEFDILMPYVRVAGDHRDQLIEFNAYRLFSRDTGVLDIVSTYARAAGAENAERLGSGTDLGLGGSE